MSDYYFDNVSVSGIESHKQLAILTEKLKHIAKSPKWIFDQRQSINHARLDSEDKKYIIEILDNTTNIDRQRLIKLIFSQINENGETKQIQMLNLASDEYKEPNRICASIIDKLLTKENDRKETIKLKELNQILENF